MRTVPDARQAVNDFHLRPVANGGEEGDGPRAAAFVVPGPARDVQAAGKRPVGLQNAPHFWTRSVVGYVPRRDALIRQPEVPLQRLPAVGAGGDALYFVHVFTVRAHRGPVRPQRRAAGPVQVVLVP